MALNFITAEEAANYVQNGDVCAFSGFTPAGAAKVVPAAIAKKAIQEHENGKEFKIGVITGASTGKSLDGELAKAKAISFRTPYQSNPDLRALINSGEVNYFDMHLSSVANAMRAGVFGKIKFAIVEACDVTPQGQIVPTSSVGISPTACSQADYVIVELNKYHPNCLRGIHDIMEPQDPPLRSEFPVYYPNDRIGSDVIKVDPKKILGVVETNLPDETAGFDSVDEVTSKIGENVANFLLDQMKKGIIPPSFLPLQSGVGNIANAVLFSLGKNPEIPNFTMYTEVIQDAVIDLMKEGRVKFASGCSLTLSLEKLNEVYTNLDFFRPKILLRPQEISNNPEIARRLGLISINTALEADIFGNVNSTHVLGQKMMNGIGGSGDFTRNAFISIFTCPSTAKGGKISTIVPMVSHLDHNEHSVQILITEWGVADLRAKSPIQKANEIINNCVHPDYREQLREYLKLNQKAHTPHTLSAAFGMHMKFEKEGTMLGVNWNEYLR
jgi:succinate CoA transferase